MLPLEALKSMKPMIATPCYASATTMGFSQSMFKLGYELGRMGVEARLELRAESQVVTSRNRLVAMFMADPTLTHLTWWDADVEAAPEQYARCLLADGDVVCGVYPLKRFDWPAEGTPQGATREQFETLCTPYPFNTIDGVLKTDAEGFGLVREATTGFMCIKRHVIEQMMAAYPDLKYVPDDVCTDEIKGLSYLLFDNMHEPVTKRFLTEDYAFCHRWRALGGEIWIDIHSKLNHLGQHNFRGDLYGSLKAGGFRNWKRT